MELRPFAIRASLGLGVLIPHVIGCSGDDSGRSSAQPADASTGPAPTGDAGIPLGPKTPYPGGRWSPPEPTYGATTETGVQIEMSDGIVLIGDVWYPTDLGTGLRASGEFPVLLTQNPYGEVFGALLPAEFFVTHGYIYASVDVRGTSRSGGVHDMFGPREAEDGAALVTWAAALEGSDGRVGLQGCSQLGINQLETATRLDENSPVKAMIPACGSGDFYRDTAFDNGIPTAVGMALGGADASAGGDMAYYRDYWRSRDRVARAPAMAAADIPMLLWSGWHEPGALGSLELFTALQNLAAGRPQSAPITADDEVSGKYQVILGDWGHAGGLDSGIELLWYDTWIKGIDTGLPTDTNTPLHLEELGGTNRWVNSGSYPLVENYTPFYFADSGTLSRSAGDGTGSDRITWAAPGLAFEFIEYLSEAFAEGAMLAGSIAARLEVTSSNTNLQLSVDIFDQAPDGSRAKITHGSILGSLRRTDPTKSWTGENGLPMRPYLTLDQDEPLTPGAPVLLDVPLWPTVWSIEPGHRIVVRIATQPRPEDCSALIGVPVGCNLTQPMLDTLPGGVYTLSRGSASLVNLPLLGHGDLSTAESAVSPTAPPQAPTLPVDW